MSRDIRSFFSVSPKGSAPLKKPKPKAVVLSSDEDDNAAKSSSKRKNLSKKSSRPVVLSDSDDEAVITKKATKVAKVETKIAKPKTVAPLDLFGSKPIKRVSSITVKKTLQKKEAEFHDDDDFDATLSQLDTAALEAECSPLFVNGNSNGKRKHLDESVEDPKAKKIRRDVSSDDKKDEANDRENGSRNDANKSSDNEKSGKAAKYKKETWPDIDSIENTSSKEKISNSPKFLNTTNKSKLGNVKGTKKTTEIVFEKNEEKKTAKKSNPFVDDYEEIIEKKKQRQVAYNRYLQRGGARNPGSKPIPEGAENCLAGLSFVITGVLESLEREETEELIQKYGGRVTKSLSKKINYIIVGDEAGASKLEKAANFGTKQISEDELFDMIRTKPAGKGSKIVQAKTTSINRKRSKSPEDRPRSPSPKKICLPAPEPKPPVATTSGSQHEPIAGSSTNATKNVTTITTDVKLEGGQLALVDKYRPKTMKQLIGQHGDQSNAKKLHTWLSNWHKNQNGSVKPPKPSPFAKKDNGAFFKACLLSGPPGIGKTTSAQVVCAELGFDLLEFNASDTRSKRLLKEEVSEILSNTTVKGYFTAKFNRKLSSNHVLLMDEVDGMAGNEDRGGLQELISLIKESEVPIICICNDRNHPKMRTLSNYTFDLRFPKPRVEQIRGAMKSLCCKEKINVTTEEIDHLILSTNQDIRQVINHLAMLGAGSNESENAQKRQANKDLRLGPWDVIRKVFSSEAHKEMSIHDKSDLFFHDYNIAGLFVQENYLSVVPKAPRGEILERIAESAESLAIGDVIESAIRKNGAWSLLPTQACFSSVIPGTLMSGSMTAQANFPGWLGRNSKRGKFDRLLQEITVHARLTTGASKESINLDYLNSLRDSILRPLALRNTEGIEDSLNVMNTYHLLREDLDSLIEVSLWPGQRDPMQVIDSKVKSAFTRAYNKSAAPAPYLINNAPKKKSNQASQDEGFMDAEDDEVASDGDNDDVDVDRMIKAKKAAAPAKKPAAKSSKRGRGKAK